MHILCVFVGFQASSLKAIRQLLSTISFHGLSICLPVSFVHCAQTAEGIDTISFACDSSMSLIDNVKIWLTLVTSSSPNFAPKWPTPVDLSVGDIRWEIATEWLDIAQWSQWRAYRKLSSLFRTVPSLTPTTFPSPNIGSQMHLPRTNFATRGATWRINRKWIIDRRQLCAVADVIMSRSMSPFAKCVAFAKTVN